MREDGGSLTTDACIARIGPAQRLGAPPSGLEPFWRPHLSETQRRRPLPPRTAPRPHLGGCPNATRGTRSALIRELLTPRSVVSLGLDESLVLIARISLAASLSVSVRVSRSRPLPVRGPRPDGHFLRSAGRCLFLRPIHAEVLPSDLGLPNSVRSVERRSARRRCSAARNASSHGQRAGLLSVTVRAVRVIRPGTVGSRRRTVRAVRMTVSGSPIRVLHRRGLCASAAITVQATLARNLTDGKCATAWSLRSPIASSTTACVVRLEPRLRRSPASAPSGLTIAFPSATQPIARAQRREAVGKCGNERESWSCVRRRCSGNPGGAWVGDPRCQAGVAIQWLWSLSRLWVAATSRHSDRAADLPLRVNRSMCRLYLICPNTGSIVIFRWA